jgi:hypothetical protein
MELSTEQKEQLEQRIKLLLYAGVDYCFNVDKDKNWWFSPNNPYYCEAFGIMQCLQVLGYGYFGAINAKGSLNYWMQQLLQEVGKDCEENGGVEAYYDFKAKIKK